MGIQKVVTDIITEVMPKKGRRIFAIQLPTPLKKDVVEISSSAKKSTSSAPKIATAIRNVEYSEEKLKQWAFEKMRINFEEYNLLKAAIENNSSPEIMANRFKNLINSDELAIFFRLISKKSTIEEKSLILDNMKLLNKIYNGDPFNPDFNELLDIVPVKKIISEVSSIADSPKLLHNKVMDLIYNAKEHKIVFGNEIVKADTCFVLNLLTGLQDYRGYNFFNNATECLVEKSCRGKNDLYYKKIAEGILKQKPELIDAMDKYIAFAKSISNIKDNSVRIRKIKNFFENLEKNGIMPKEIELKTIIPDENAFASVKNTVEHFRKKCSNI